MADENEELFDMSDEALEAAFKAAKADEDSPEVGVEDDAEEEIEAESEEEEEEEVDEDTEQPSGGQDSDDNSEEDEDEVESEEDSEEDESTEDDSDEKPADEKTEAEAEAQPVQKRKYKANGQEFEFTDTEIFDQFGKVFGQAMNYTQKMQAFAPYKGMIATLKEQNLDQDDLNMAIDVLKGDKDAIADILKRKGVDALDLDMDGTDAYQPKNYGRNEAELAIQEVVDEIGKDAEYQTTHRVIEDQWDSKSRDTFASNPGLIKELHIDVKNGVFDKVSPMATKLKILDGGRKSDIEYYMEAGKGYYGELDASNKQQELQNENTRVAEARAVEDKKFADAKAGQAKRVEVKKASKRRKAAAPTKSRAGKKDVVDYLDDSDEGFEDWYKKLQDNI